MKESIGNVDIRRSACYASPAGGCSGKISSEHYISRSILNAISDQEGTNRFVYEKRINPNNSWRPKKLDTGRMTARILCRHHNNMFSKFDAAGHLMCVHSDLFHRTHLGSPAAGNTMEIDGDSFERWMLKTLSGGMMSRKIWPELAEFHSQRLKIHWLQHLVQGKEFAPGHGIYFLPIDVAGCVNEHEAELTLNPIISTDGENILGLRAWFYGLRFDLIVENLLPDPNSPYTEANYRPSSIRLFGSNAAIHFKWKSFRLRRETLVTCLK